MKNYLREYKIGLISSSVLILIGYATAFFPRLLSFFGAPSAINFIHFGVIPSISILVLFKTRVKIRKQINLVWDLMIGMAFLLTITLVSAILNHAGIVNIVLQFLFQIEAFLLLAAIISIPMAGKSLHRFRKYLLGFALFNLLLALAQSVLLPIGIYPKPKGGTFADNITGVFGGGGGSAANYVSCTISFYFAIYVFFYYKKVPLWLRMFLLLAACYQIQVSDSKQVFIALAFGYGILLLTRLKNLFELVFHIVFIIVLTFIVAWILLNINIELLEPYQNWINRDIWGFDGLAIWTKFSAFRIIPRYFVSSLNWLFGLGPGHTVTRLGGWVMRDYATLLLPLGATTHAATKDVWAIVDISYLPRESTIYFPLFTWAGIWGDIGVVGFFSYIYLCSIVWRKICVDEFGRFLLISSAILGCILTQIEEPAHMVTLACLLGMRWHEEKEKKKIVYALYVEYPEH
ncbi:hypothetical protein [Acaryochloris marina]|uniref:hypothetical protein n=1 Tax=Acaryochloris marina TaxID=155978 RepID=UPI001BAF40D2|nr:hypothetical protein [Acaryochloris marina]QUY44832.1 hypothetical protein I1H34_12560 [Acaryochloris marina S15]